MSDIEQKIETVQYWLIKIQQPPTENDNLLASGEAENILNKMLVLIQSQDMLHSTNLSETPTDLARWLQEQTTVLSLANGMLKNQLIEHEKAEMTLRQAHNNLETQLQDHISNLFHLNQLLQDQIKEHKDALALEQEERTLTNALRDTLSTMSNTFDLGKVLDHILDNVGRVTPYDAANILFVESDLVHVVRQRGYVPKEQEKDWLSQRIPLTKLAILQQMIDLGKPLAIADISASPMWIGFPGLDWVQSNVIAPIRSNGKVLGFLSLDSATVGHFTQIHAERLQSFADQAAIAIQNARLLERAKKAAVTAERNRIANELHDTLSQTLWSVSLITERLPAIWEVDKDNARRSLVTIHELVQSALSEMRSLMLELLPSAITDQNLGDLIRQAAIVMANRAGIAISVHIEAQEAVPREVHFVLYRVAQEALNNIARHAMSDNVEIYFNSQGGLVTLAIKDDGQGFNPADINHGHLGLSIMADRIQNIGGTLEIISDVGQGTTIKVLWQAPNPSINEA